MVKTSLTSSKKNVAVMTIWPSLLMMLPLAISAVFSVDLVCKEELNLIIFFYPFDKRAELDMRSAKVFKMKSFRVANKSAQYKLIYQVTRPNIAHYSIYRQSPVKTPDIKISKQ